MDSGQSGASFHMTHLADILSVVRLYDDKLKIGGSHLIQAVGLFALFYSLSLLAQLYTQT